MVTKRKDLNMMLIVNDDLVDLTVDLMAGLMVDLAVVVEEVVVEEVVVVVVVVEEVVVVAADVVIDGLGNRRSMTQITILMRQSVSRQISFMKMIIKNHPILSIVQVKIMMGITICVEIIQLFV